MDGYPDGVGKTLHEYYSKYEDIKKLLKLGNIESLREKLNPDLNSNNDVTIAYHRDLKERMLKNKAMINKNLDDFNKVLFHSWIGYVYLYDEKNQKWLYDNYSIDRDLLSLKSLDEYFKISNKLKEISCEEVKELRNDNNYECLVLQGCGGDLTDWVVGFTDLLKDEGIVNDSFSFDNIYFFENNDLANLIFTLDSKDINMSKLAIFRLKIRNDFGAMWLSDYIDNGYIKNINI